MIMERNLSFAKRIARNIGNDLWGRTKKHYITCYFCNLAGFAAIAVGLYTHTWHNVLFGFMFFVFGRVYLNCDFDPESPYDRCSNFDPESRYNKFIKD